MSSHSARSRLRASRVLCQMRQARMACRLWGGASGSSYASGCLCTPARGPLIAPLFIRFRARAFRIGGLFAGFLSAILLAAHCECVSCAWVCFELASNVADLGIAQHAAGVADCECEVAHARVE
eukprot:5783717-Pleurochrysis_carterae.AAC.2